MNNFLISAIVLLVAQLTIAMVVGTIGEQIGYRAHQVLCGIGTWLMVPIWLLCILSAAST